MALESWRISLPLLVTERQAIGFNGKPWQPCATIGFDYQEMRMSGTAWSMLEMMGAHAPLPAPLKWTREGVMQGAVLASFAAAR
jgi:hypothetical protein